MPTIREVRVEQNKSQADIAVLAGVSTSAISRMENGHPVQKTTFNVVCQALGVLPKDITGVVLYSAVQAAAGRKRKYNN